MTVELSDHHRRVVARVIEQEQARRHHVVVALSGAHAYGFPSPDSDLDLKAIHVEPTARLLGLAPPPAHADRLEILDGVEVDYTSNELQPVLVGLLAGNGNYLERILGPILLHVGPEHAALAALARGAVSRRFYRHYHGFATGMLREAAASEAPTAKRLLYVLRTALTGAHLMATGELVTELPTLLSPYGFGGARELLVAKQAGERVPLDAGVRPRWIEMAERALATLDAARAASRLPDEAPNRAEVDAWLVAQRRAHM